MIATTVMLNREALFFLDSVRVVVRARHNAVLDRSALMRAIVKAVNRSGVELWQARSEEEVSMLLTEILIRGDRA